MMAAAGDNTMMAVMLKLGSLHMAVMLRAGFVMLPLTRKFVSKQQSVSSWGLHADEGGFVMLVEDNRCMSRTKHTRRSQEIRVNTAEAMTRSRRPRPNARAPSPSSSSRCFFSLFNVRGLKSKLWSVM